MNAVPSVAERVEPAPTLPEQVPRLLTHIAGYVAHRSVALGLRTGLIEALAGAGRAVSADDLAAALRLDPFGVAVWCRAALACGLCERPYGDAADADPAGLGGRYELAPHVATLLLDSAHPAYLGAVFTVLEQDEVFDRFERTLGTGERLWWDGCRPEWIAGVAGTGAPFYTRLAPGGLGLLPALAQRLTAGCHLVDIACGSGAGLVHLARTYPNCSLSGVDGDRHSLRLAQTRLDEAGLGDRCRLIHSPLEEFTLPQRAACVVNNISMHECRDVDRVVARVRAALEPGGWLVISDFPFPDTIAGLRSIPGRVMTGIQFFEAQIDDQLLPRANYDDLLTRHDFTEIGSAVLSPVHALTYGRTAP